MEYKLITETKQKSLENEVNKHLKQGWKLQGGVSISQKQGNLTNIFCQALVA